MRHAVSGINVEVFRQARQAKVHPHEQHFFVEQREADGGIDGDECFSLFRFGGSHHHYLLILAECKEQVGTKHPESFFCFAVLVGNHGYISRSGNRNFAQRRNVGVSVDVGAALDTEVKQVFQEDDECRNEESEEEGNHKHHHPFWFNHPAYGSFVEYFGFGSRSSQREGVFFAFLQQHKEKARFDLLFAGYFSKLTFLSRSCAGLAFVIVHLALRIAACYAESLFHTGNATFYSCPKAFYLTVEFLNHRIGLGVGTQQSVAFQYLPVVFVDGGSQGRIFYPHIARNQLVSVPLFVDVGIQVIHQIELSAYFHQFLLVLTPFLQ